MKDYFGKIQEYFQKTLEENSLTDSEEAQMFEQALILLEKDPIKVNKIFEQDDKLKSMFGFTNHQLQIIQSESESEDTQIDEAITINSSESSDKESIEETVRMDAKTTFPKMHTGYAVGRGPPNTGKKRKGPKNPFPIPEKLESRFDTTFGRNILNLDCQKDRKMLIDGWARMLSFKT